jgi:hypothetical protein
MPEPYRVHGRRAGITLLHPWANRLGADRFSTPGAEVALAPGDKAVARDARGLPIHGLARAGAWTPEAIGSVVSLEPMTAPTDVLRSGRGLRLATRGTPITARFSVEVRDDRRREVDALRDQVRAWAQARSEVSAVALVGSWARGTPGAGSGVDLVVIADPVTRYLTTTPGSWSSAPPRSSARAGGEPSPNAAWPCRADSRWTSA